MLRNKFVPVAFFISVLIGACSALSCLPCTPNPTGQLPDFPGVDCTANYLQVYSNCPEPDKQSLDICGCCPVCRKGLGEQCGGTWGELGDCLLELECVGEMDDYMMGPNFMGVCRDKILTPTPEPEGPTASVFSLSWWICAIWTGNCSFWDLFG